jgi:uncharacterized protein YhjY with autotransporter beta-barrel domain
MAKVIHNGGWCVRHSNGEVVRCHNYATARYLAKNANRQFDEQTIKLQKILNRAKWTNVQQVHAD